jgi:primosomal replication protein N
MIKHINKNAEPPVVETMPLRTTAPAGVPVVETMPLRTTAPAGVPVVETMPLRTTAPGSSNPGRRTRPPAD